MAGATGFSGMPLGSFSGRGADLSPFQFIMEQRARAAQQAEQKKLAQQQMQQSFTMALMAKKQQEAEMAQQGQQFQAQQQQRIAEKEMAAEQFRAEQDRIREATRAQDELRKLGETRQADELEQRRLEAKAIEDRDAQRRGLQAKGAEAMTWVATQAAPVLATNIERLGDPVGAIDATEAWLLDAAQRDQDPERRAQTIAQIADWRAEQEKKLLGRETIKSITEARAASAEDRAHRTKQGAVAEKNKVKVAGFKAELAGIQDDLKMWAEDLLDSPGNTEIQNKINDARKRRNEIYKELAAME